MRMDGTSWVDAVFSERPEQWGLRGDPYLWSELRESLRAYERPVGSRELNAILQSEFQRLIGVSVTHPEDVYIERFACGGMSSGYISMTFWRDRAIPELCKRFEMLCARGKQQKST